MSLISQLFLDTLRRTERADAGALRDYQFSLLEQLARHAALQTTFYRERLRSLFVGENAHSGEFVPNAWREVPILDRAMAACAGPSLRALEIPLAASSFVDSVSTGAKGIALAHRISAFSTIASMCARNRMWEAHNVDLFTTCARIESSDELDARPPLGAKLGNWNMTGRLNRGRQMDRSVSLDMQWTWLKRLRPVYLESTPDVICGLLDLVDEDSDGLSLKGIFTRGGEVDEELQRRAADSFGCSLIDSYDLRETGSLACQCPQGAYHAQSEIALIEVLRRDGENARPGERGRIIATPFYQYATPLLRYDTGDEALVGEKCGCGRAGLTLTKIYGRRRRLFDFGEGRRVAGTRLAQIASTLQARRIELRQTEQRRIEILYCDGDASQEAEAINLVVKAFDVQGLLVTARAEALSERTYPEDPYVPLASRTA
ncbi:MAG TPA: hypothetical protein VEH76_03595 [Methylocystis sp.]|nr:hypothetical protein [Methylocystis sp.]